MRYSFNSAPSPTVNWNIYQTRALGFENRVSKHWIKHVELQSHWLPVPYKNINVLFFRVGFLRRMSRRTANNINVRVGEEGATDSGVFVKIYDGLRASVGYYFIFLNTMEATRSLGYAFLHPR